MIKVEQQNWNNPRGDCFAASLASILELKLEEIPPPQPEEHDSNEAWGGYLERLNTEFLKEHGLYMTVMPYPMMINNRTLWFPKGYAMRCGTQLGAPRNHVIVSYNGSDVWDPSPVKVALPQTLYWIVLIPYDPIDVVQPEVYGE